MDMRGTECQTLELLPLLLLLDIDGSQRLPHKVLGGDRRVAPLLASDDSTLVGLSALHSSEESPPSLRSRSGSCVCLSFYLCHSGLTRHLTGSCRTVTTGELCLKAVNL